MGPFHKSALKICSEVFLDDFELEWVYTRTMRSLGKISRFFSGNYKILLICLFLLFLLRPYGGMDFYLPIWKMTFAGSLVAAVFNCHHRRSIKIVCLILALPAIVFGWLNSLYPIAPIVITNVGITVCFLVICTYSILYGVILRARVTLETLRGVVCAYFMVAFAFAYAYYLIEYIIPGTFFITRQTISASSYAEYLAELIYFSFVTLLTIGYGDITPVKELGQTIVVLEGIVGQFYIAILVARIVAVYSISSFKGMIEKGKI